MSRGARGFHTRKAINSEHDPYLSKEAPKDMSICRKCRSVYHEKRWYRNDELPEHLRSKIGGEVFCPACQKIRDKYSEGFVIIEGNFPKEHREELMRLLEHKKSRAMSINPLEQIIEVKEHEGRIEITTTTEKFAQRIGKILTKAFNGKIEYKWTDDTKIARIIWVREDEGAG